MKRDFHIESAIAIVTTFYVFNQKRLYRETLGQAEGMIQAASLAFSRAMARNDEVMLDALVHELESYAELHIQGAYVRPDGRVVAHTDLDEYGKMYDLPAPMTRPEPSRLSEIVRRDGGSFSVVSLLQSGGETLGALVVSFATGHLARKLREETVWTVLATLPVLLLSGIGVVLYGRRMTLRLKRLQDKALAIGRGEWDDPIEVSGSDEIAQLTESFNQMLSDLVRLRERERSSAETIAGLNRDLSAQLKKVEGLKERLLEENAALREELLSLCGAGDLIGSDGSIRRLVEQARRLASLPVTVLISGESGTGKDLVARLLHDSGSRADGPFVTVNCAAMPSPLIESELFGHVKGAFTGAVALATSQVLGPEDFVFATSDDGSTLHRGEEGEAVPPFERLIELCRLSAYELKHRGFDRIISACERICLEASLVRARNQKEAARELGITPPSYTGS